MNTKHLMITLACSVCFAGMAQAGLSTSDMRALPKVTYDLIAGKIKEGDTTDKLIKLKKGFKIYMRGKDENQKNYSYELTFDNEGKLLYSERKVKFRDLPAAVQNAVQAPLPAAANGNTAKPAKAKPAKGPNMNEYTIVAYEGCQAGQKIYACSKGMFKESGQLEETFKELD